MARSFIAMTVAWSLGFAAVSAHGAGAGERGDTLTIGTGTDIISLDPGNHGTNATSAVLINLYDQLVNADFSTGTLEFRPSLAEKWERTSPTTWVFDLRRDVRWHNGDPFTAEDVKFTIDRLQDDRKLRSNGKFSTVREVRVLSPHRVEIETDGVDALLLHKFVGVGPNILPRKAFEAAGTPEKFFAEPVGTGPYRFGEWAKADRVTLLRNDQWWGGKPKWEKVVFRALPETTTRVSELITGGVDIATAVPPEDIARINANTATRTAASNIARNCILLLRTAPDTLTGDPRVREAIDIAIDRDVIVKDVLSGLGVPTRGFFPPEIPGANPDLDKDYRFDPQRARQLLAEAGHANGFELEFATPNGRYIKDKEVAEVIAGYLEDIGIRVKLQVLDWTVYKDRQQADKFGEAYFRCMGSYTDASSFYRRDWNEHHKWNSAEYDALAREGGVEADDARRNEISRKTQAIVADERPQIGIYFPKANYGINNRIDFAPRFDELFIAEDISLK